MTDLTSPPAPEPAPTTLVIWYRGRETPTRLMRALDELQRSGQVTAIEVEKVDPLSGRIFVLGQEDAIRALDGLADVVAVTEPGEAPADRVDGIDKSDEIDDRDDEMDEPLSPPLPEPPAPDPALPAPETKAGPDPVENDRAPTQDAPAQPLGAPHWHKTGPPDPTAGDLAPRDVTANGFITGVVTADDGGASLENVSVCAYQSSPYVYECALTDASGVYSISVPGGTYQVWFTPGNHYISEYYDDVPLDQYNDYTPVTVSDDTVTPDINASLAPGAQVIGQVTAEASGDPLTGIAVNLYGGPSEDYYAGAYTGAGGVYTTTPGLPAGSYQVEFRDYNGVYAFEYYSDTYRVDLATPLEITTIDRTGINAALAQAAVITGVVTGSGPLSDIQVSAYYSDTQITANSDNTDVTGTYRIAGLGPIDYKLRFRDNNNRYLTEWHQDRPDWDVADPVALSSGVTTTVNAQLTLEGVISGTVTAEGSGDPLEDIRVRAYDATTENYVDSDYTNISGTYRIGLLVTGTYKLYFSDNNDIYLDEYYDDQPDLDSADPVAVSAGITTTVDAQLTPGGVISGTVTAEGSGDPLENVQVTAYDATTHDYIRSDTTNISGTYRIGALVARDYKLYFYDNNEIYLDEYYDDQPDLSSADPVAVSAGMTTTVDAQLTPGGIITGTVTAQGSGDLLENVRVTAYDAATDDYVNQEYTDASGVYRIGALAAGDYKLRFYDNNEIYLEEYYDDQPDLDSADPVAVSAGMTTTVDAQLTPGGVITGTVTAQGSGDLLESVRVTAYDAVTDDYVNQDYTDASGVYRIGALAAGNYKLRFYDNNGLYLTEYYDDKPDLSSADPVTVTASATTTVDAQLSLAGVITGTVTAQGSGDPLEDIRVNLYDATTNGYVSSDYTDASGVYHVGRLADGTYKLRFEDFDDIYVTEYYDDKPDLSSADPVTVSAGMTSTANAQLVRGGAIVGTITAEGSGSPLEGISVTAYDAATNSSVSSDSTDDAGTYRVGALGSGSYKLRFRDSSGAYITEYYEDQPDLSNGDPITLTSGTTTTVDAQLARAAVFSGTVTAQGSGDPLEDVRVNVYEAATGDYVEDDYTDASGAYQVGGLVGGSYKLRFYDSNGLYLTEYHDDKPDLDSADPVTVTSGTTTTIDAQLSRAAIISGVVTAQSSGAPLEGIRVQAYDAATGDYMEDDYTDASGAYRVGGLATGSYKLRFYDYDGLYLTEYYNDKPDLSSADPISTTAGMTTVVNAQLTRAGVITGTVTEEGSGILLEGIRVRVYDAATDNYLDSDYTDASGVYQLGRLATGNYKLRFSDNDGIYLQAYYKDKIDLVSADPVAVTAGMTTTVNAALKRGGRITGRVTDALSGAGIAGVSVRAERQDADTTDGSATTDASGYYTTSALYTGVYRVYFGPPLPYYYEYYDNYRNWDAFTPVTVTAPSIRSGIDAALRTGYLITGTVTGADGAPLEDVYVRAYRGGSSSATVSRYTDSEGRYQLGPLDPARYRLFFESPDQHASEWYDDAVTYADADVINLAGDATNVNAQLALGAVITGMVTGPGGAPVEDVDVYVYPVGGNDDVAYGWTDADGHYVTEPGLPTGSYQVQFSAPPGYTSEWYDDQATQGGATVVTVTAGLTRTNVNAELATYAGGAITGTVTAADTGQPLNMWVYAYNSQGSSVRSDRASGGKYVLDHLPPDTYRVRFSASSPYLQVYYNGHFELSDADPVAVTAGMTVTHIDQAVPRGGVITGTVTGSDTGTAIGATGVPGVYVYTRRFVGGYDTGSTYTGVDGAYRLDGLEGGGYKVQFSPQAPFIGEWYQDAASENGGQAISVTLNTTTPDIDAVLAKGGVITGVITAADTGAPLPSAYANVYSGTGSFISNIYADMDGFYHTPGLPAGDHYRVRFYEGPWSLYLPEWYDDALSQDTSMTVTVPVSGTTPNINAALERGGSISGWTYAAATGLPVSSVYARVEEAASGAFANSDNSNNYGFYQVEGLRSGQYHVYFSEGGYKSQWYDRATSESTALTVTVTAPNDTPDINAYLVYANEIYLPLVLRNH